MSDAGPHRRDMDQDLITDITLDHLPDLSDASVSFQIPAYNASVDLLHTDAFDLLEDDDPSFAPVTCEPTPRVQATLPPPPRSRSPTPTPLPSSSAHPSVTLRPLTLGHRSPIKSRQTPSCPISIQSPLVSEERFDQLRAQVATLGHADDPPPHVIQPARARDECPTPNSKLTPDCLPVSEDLLPEEKDTHQLAETSADQDVVMPTRDNAPADATNIAVPPPPPKSNRNPRTIAKPVSHQL